jgi:hypothetical protein
MKKRFQWKLTLIAQNHGFVCRYYASEGIAERWGKYYVKRGWYHYTINNTAAN